MTDTIDLPTFYTLISRGEAALALGRADPLGQHYYRFKRTLDIAEAELWACYERCK